MTILYALITFVVLAGLVFGFLYGWRYGFILIAIALFSGFLSYIYLSVNKETPSFIVWFVSNLVWDFLVFLGLRKVSFESIPHTERNQ